MSKVKGNKSLITQSTIQTPENIEKNIYLNQLA